MMDFVFIYALHMCRAHSSIELFVWTYNSKNQKFFYCIKMSKTKSAKLLDNQFGFGSTVETEFCFTNCRILWLLSLPYDWINRVINYWRKLT